MWWLVVTVATWNLENLFWPGEESGRPSGQREYRAKLDALAATITEPGQTFWRCRRWATRTR